MVIADFLGYSMKARLLIVVKVDVVPALDAKAVDGDGCRQKHHLFDAVAIFRETELSYKCANQ